MFRVGGWLTVGEMTGQNVGSQKDDKDTWG